MNATRGIALALVVRLSSCGGDVAEERTNLADECRSAEVPECAACEGLNFRTVDDPVCRACWQACAGAGCGAAVPLGGEGAGRTFCVIDCEERNGELGCPPGYRCYRRVDPEDWGNACFPEELW